MRSFLNKIYLFWAFTHFVWLMFLCMPFIIIPLMIDEKRGGAFAYRVQQFWSYWFCALSGIFFKVRGRENLKKDGQYIFTANHSSFLDAPAIVQAIPYQFKALGKKEILDYPIFGFIFKYIGVSVDRSDRSSRKASLDVIRKKIQKGIHVTFFPEGKMNTGSDPLLRFYDGAFWLAVETGASVVPMHISNSRELLPRKTWMLRPGIVTVTFGKPIPTKGLTTKEVPEIRAKTREAILELMGKEDPVAE